MSSRVSRRGHAAVGAAAIALLAAWWPFGGAGPYAGANVVVVVIDTLRADRLATYGYERQTAPFLDGLARRGVVFDGLSPSSWTKPATASLLTGLHPLRHQAIARTDALPRAARTLAELLRAEGYRTFGVSANRWVSPPFGFAQGFEQLVVGEADDSAVLSREIWPALDAIEEPFFLYVHWMDPHSPYAPRIAWDGGPPPTGGPVRVHDLHPYYPLQRDPAALSRARDLYDGEIRGADDSLARLMRELERRGFLDRALVVVTSDHGEEFEDHGRLNHGASLYQEVVRVPLVFYANPPLPAARPGRASLLDVVPTLLDLVGVDAPPGHGFDGQSLAEVVQGRATVDPARSFLLHVDLDGAAVALVSGRHKLVLSRWPYAKQLFDLAADPGERTDRLGAAPSTFSALARLLATSFNQLSSRALRRERAAVDAGLRAQLDALGYAGPDAAAERRLPRRSGQADARPDGLLGLEGPRSFASCVEPVKPDAERQLRGGWYAPERDGRWTEKQAAVALARPRTRRAALVVRGVSHHPGTMEAVASVSGRVAARGRLAPGAFTLRGNVDLGTGDWPVVVSLEVDSAFVPARHGGEDPRSLGLFVTSACLTADPSGEP
jgi:arylsulfatase A-like enzyme